MSGVRICVSASYIIEDFPVTIDMYQGQTWSPYIFYLGIGHT